MEMTSKEHINTVFGTINFCIKKLEGEFGCLEKLMKLLKEEIKELKEDLKWPNYQHWRIWKISDEMNKLEKIYWDYNESKIENVWKLNDKLDEIIDALNILIEKVSD